MVNKRKEQLNKLLNLLGLVCPIENIDIALTHSSYCHENNLQYKSCNERLEFLGDAVLKLVVSNYLFAHYPDYNEGDLSLIRSNAISDETLAKVALDINLQDYIILGNGEEKTNGRCKNSNIACAFEALLGALYLDGEFEQVKNFIEKMLCKEIELFDTEGIKANPKALLQEYLQSFSNNLPEYIVTKQEGPPHKRTFYVDLFFEEKHLASGKGSTKKAAQKQAAQDACIKLNLLNVTGEEHV